MFPPLPREIAHHYCIKAISQIEAGKLQLKQITEISQERLGQGLMIGCLVCWDEKSHTRKILLAVSGISRQLEGETDENTIIVPPIVTNEQITQVLSANDRAIHQLTDKLNLLLDGDEKNNLIKQRTQLTDESLKKVFSLYKFYCINGTVTLDEIIAANYNRLPPTGTGDCCAPKLLSYAFEKGLRPISMDEVYYGKNTKNKINGNSYAPCDERCGIVLPYMLGLEVLYRDESIIVVNKPSGLLSVPGRGEDKQDCVVNRVKALIPEAIEQPSVHRLDMETSGLLVLALTAEAQRKLSIQFENGIVKKNYTALLDGVLPKAKGEMTPHKGETNGVMELKFRLDVENRPHQIYDEINGKNGITEWIYHGVENFKNPVTGEVKKVTRMTYIPHTGRTHQLRLASSDLHGFGLPIVGDSLYGSCGEGERLMLHACKLQFEHPVSGKEMCFECKAEF